MALGLGGGELDDKGPVQRRGDEPRPYAGPLCRRIVCEDKLTSPKLSKKAVDDAVCRVGI